MNNSFLKTEPVGKLLFSLGFPMMIAMLINSLYNIIDSIYVSRLGTTAVTALSIIFPLQNLTIAVSVGLGVGISSVLSRQMGGNKLEEAERSASAGLGLAVIHFLIFFLIGLFLIESYVGIYSSRGTTTYDWSVQYGRIVLCLSLPYLLYLVIEKIFQSIGWMKTTMVVMTVGAVTNIILDPVLIFGFWKIPPLGVSGAALATVLAQFLTFILFVIIYKVTRFPIKIHLNWLVPNKESAVSIYTVALPAALTLGLPSVLVGILNGILITYSEIAVAVLGLYYKVQTFFYMPVSGLCQGMRPLIGYNYGAHEYERVKQTVRLSIIISAVIFTLGTFLLFVFPNQVMDLFAPEEKLRQMGVVALQIISLGFVPSAVSIICNGAFEAFGLGSYSLVISLMRQLIIIVPTAYFLSMYFKEIGVFAAFPIAEVITALISCFLLKKAYQKLGIKFRRYRWIF